jgi:hypothetical protein
VYLLRKVSPPINHLGSDYPGDLCLSLILTFSRATLSAALIAMVLDRPFPLPAQFNRSAPRSTAIEWEPCGSRRTRNITCGRFEVPLDHHNETAGKASLYVVRYPATNSTLPTLGTLFLNPGGPGMCHLHFMFPGWILRC